MFRHGDWNVAKPHSIQHSVTCNDFHIKPFTTSETGGFKDTKEQTQDKGDLTKSDSKESLVSPKGTDQQTGLILFPCCNMLHWKNFSYWKNSTD